jgi:hypothetical protein
MTKVKVFSTQDASNMESQINEWLGIMDGQIEITQILQSSCFGGSYYHWHLISIFYTEK